MSQGDPVPSGSARPVVVAFDGSAPASAALRVATEELPGRHLLIVSVWEPGFATAMLTPIDAAGMAYLQPTPTQIAHVDRVQRDNATEIADVGVETAQRLGAASVEAVPIRDDAANIADTVRALADEHDAAMIVVGSRGLGAVKASLLGSTTRRLLSESRRPVLVVRDGDDA